MLGSKILLCDEPVSGLDPVRSREISDLIRDVSREIGSTTVVASHDMHNAFRIADRLVLVRDKRIAMEGSAEDFRKSTDRFMREFLSASGLISTSVCSSCFSFILRHPL